MASNPRRIHCSSKFSAHWVRSASTSAIVQFDVHANQIKQWKDQLLEATTGVFGDVAKTEPTTPTVDVKTLHAKIGELTLENDFLSGALGKAGLLGGGK